MNETYDRISYLLEEAVRIEVALACRSGPTTKAEIARKLGRKPGGVTVITTLQAEGVLEQAGYAPSRGTRKGGQRWCLADDWGEVVDRAAAIFRRGLLAPGLELVLIKATDVIPAAELLAGQESLIAWGSPLKGEQMGLLLCPAHEPDDARSAYLLNLLSLREVQPIRIYLPAVMSEPELRDWARDISRSGAPRLPNAE